MANEEERIALFFDYENLALGARDRGDTLDVGVIMDALTERGRVVIRRAYADWNLFADHRQALVAQRVELIEVPQRTGFVRKNAADIKLAVDALEVAFEREFITSFVIASGDSDFTPLVLKLRELNRRVIGIGVEGSTSDLLPGACDEFLFYERLAGRGSSRPARKRESRAKDQPEEETSDLRDVARTVTRTLSGLKASSDGPVLSSMIKRVILRKDPAFSESDYGFRTWGELVSYLASKGTVELRPSASEGDPYVEFASNGGGEEQAFTLLHDIVAELEDDEGSPLLSGLKDQMRKRQPNFSEKDFGYGGFLQFVKAANARGIVSMGWDDELEDYYVETA
ncbi:MAG: NYN domain-containing protein [Actinomycetota bacterium]|nr:NYN domain-containing protein [Actinomycetota bacterium]